MTLINLEVLWSYLWRYAIIASFFFGLGFMLGCGGEDARKEVLTVDQINSFWGAPRQTVVDTLGDPCFSHVDLPTGAKSPRGETMFWPATGVVDGLYLKEVTVTHDCSNYKPFEDSEFVCFVNYPSVCSFADDSKGCPTIFGCGYFPAAKKQQ